MIEILFEHKLCSINRRYINRNYTLSDEYRNCKALLKVTCRRFYPYRELITEPVGVSIQWDKGRMDLDASVKVISDALQGEVYKNDSQVQLLKIEHVPKAKTIIKVWLL